MANKVDIWNMALGHIGTSQPIAEENERSPEAFACRRYWDTCRDALFSYRDMDWKFATAVVALADLGSPPDGWGYRYRYPNDCINARDILADGIVRSPLLNDIRFPFEIAYEANGRVILCDVEAASLRYTKRIEEADRYPAYFVEAMAFRLASMIAMPLKADMSIRNDLITLAEQFAQIAMAASLNEGAPDPAPQSVYEQEMHA